MSNREVAVHMAPVFIRPTNLDFDEKERIWNWLDDSTTETIVEFTRILLDGADEIFIRQYRHFNILSGDTNRKNDGKFRSRGDSVASTDSFQELES